MTDKLFPTFAFLGLVLVLIPLPWHLQAWNAGTCLFMIWTAIGCLIHFVNSIVWNGNLEVHSAVWCDIATKLIIGLSVALPCASLCINRRLYLIARMSQVHTTTTEKRRAVCIDIAIGLGFPIIIMALHYIVQGHRFDIFEDIGCWPATVNMPPAYPLVWMWPIVIGLISMVFCGLSLHALLKRRNKFNELLATNQNLSANRYFRLMALATVEIVTTTPIAIYFMYLNLTTSPPIPWVSLSDTHFNFSRIVFVPAFIVNAQPQLKLNFNLNRWLFPACALIFFAFFGLAEEARRNYKKFYHAIVKFFGMTPRPRTILGKPPRLIVSLPTTHTGSVYESPHSSAKWDALSLKMPEIKEDVLPVPVVNRPASFAGSNVSMPLSHAPDAQSGALGDSQWWTSRDSSYSLSAESGPSNPPSPTQTLSFPVPALTITRPSTDVLHSTTEMPPPPPHRSASQRSSHQRSISPDSKISISSAYFPEPDVPSRYDQAFSNQHAFQTSSDSAPAQPHNGVQVTIETSVV